MKTCKKTEGGTIANSQHVLAQLMINDTHLGFGAEPGHAHLSPAPRPAATWPGAACLPASHHCRLLATCSAPGTRSPGPALVPVPRTAQRPAPKIPAQEQQRETKPKSNTGETKSNQINRPEGKRRRRPPFPSICSTRSQRSITKILTLGEGGRRGKPE